MKILQIIWSFKPGGAERMAAYLICGLDRSRFEVKVASINSQSNSELESLLSSKAVNVLYMNRASKYDIKVHFRLDRIIKAFCPDVIHTHLGALLYAFPAMIFRRVPVNIHTMHTLAEKENRSRGRFINSLAFKSGVIPVAISNSVKTSIARVYGLGDVPVIPNGIPIEKYQNPLVERSVWRSREGFNEGDIIFVFIAGLKPEKNHNLLLRAFAKVARLSLNARLLLVGDGESKAALNETADNLKLSGRVRFLCYRSDIPDILAASDVFVLSSDFEGDPLCIKEAMAAGKPVIATAVGGIPELLVNNKTGILVQKGDVEELSQAMLHFINHEDAIKQMGYSGAIKARESFDVNLMVKAYAGLYRRMVR